MSSEQMVGTYESYSSSGATVLIPMGSHSLNKISRTASYSRRYSALSTSNLSQKQVRDVAPTHMRALATKVPKNDFVMATGVCHRVGKLRKAARTERALGHVSVVIGD